MIIVGRNASAQWRSVVLLWNNHHERPICGARPAAMPLFSYAARQHFTCSSRCQIGMVSPRSELQSPLPRQLRLNPPVTTSLFWY